MLKRKTGSETWENEGQRKSDHNVVGHLGWTGVAEEHGPSGVTPCAQCTRGCSQGMVSATAPPESHWVWQSLPIAHRPCSCAGSFTAAGYPPSPLRKHQESKESDGRTGSWCLDKAVLARDARYLARRNDISHG